MMGRIFTVPHDIHATETVVYQVSVVKIFVYRTAIF